MREQTLVLMRKYGWTWGEVRSMPGDVVRELVQMDSIEDQLRKGA